jgi:hypothetical protein
LSRLLTADDQLERRMAIIEEIEDTTPAGAAQPASRSKGRPHVADTAEIAAIELLTPLPLITRIYTLPFVFLYPLAGWVYFFK